MQNLTMNIVVKPVRATGGIGVVRMFVLEDAEWRRRQRRRVSSRSARIPLLHDVDEKPAHATGQANVKAYDRKMRDVIAVGRAKPSVIISLKCSLGSARRREHFSRGDPEKGRRNISIDNIDLIAQAIGDPPHELMDPNLPKQRGLDETLTRSPWTVRPYVIKER